MIVLVDRTVDVNFNWRVTVSDVDGKIKDSVRLMSSVPDILMTTVMSMGDA